MRNACIKSYNKFYDVDSRLKTKQKGRNQDINVKDMDGYKDFKKQLKRKEQKLAKANEQTVQLDNESKNINRILDNLKPTLMNKNNMIISSEDVHKIKNFTKDVKDTNKTVRSVNDLNLAIKYFEYSAYEVEKENIKVQLQKFKGFWHNLMSHFHKKITYDNDQNYKIVSDDLYRNGIFDDNDNEIANNIYRKVTIPDENKNNKLKKKNDYNLN